MIETTPEQVRAIYAAMRERLAVVRARLGRPLTLAEKVLFGHLHDPAGQELRPGAAYLALRPDRVIMQDATAQMALLQFMQARLPRVQVPATIHCDHLIQAHAGAGPDTLAAQQQHQEVYDFLRSAAAHYGLGFWGPGSGIIHQVVLENHAFPGGLLIGSDSHTPNMGGLGMLAIGVGGADAAEVMAGLPWEVLHPRLVGVRLVGELQGWTAPKDVILWLCGRLTVRGGTNRVLEYLGPGARSLSATGKATIANMGAELGATGSICPYDARMGAYLAATGRGELAALAREHEELLQADPEVEQAPEAYFDEVITLDLAALPPMIVGPHSPDVARPLTELARDVAAHGYPAAISVSLIGSCTNSSYEDMLRVADVARQAAAAGARPRTPLMVSPGSAMILATMARDGLLATLEQAGAKVLANACGPCIGQWQRDGVARGTRNTIVTSFNRNFPGRNDSNPETFAFVASPEVVLALSLAGSLTLDPLHDPLPLPGGGTWRLSPPPRGAELPPAGFVTGRAGYQAPPEDGRSVPVLLPSGSDRLQVLDPFEPMVDAQWVEMPVLIKTRGKTTTDQISPAGAWLRYRGHLDRISDNMLTGAINAWTGERGTTLDLVTGATDVPVPRVARAYHARGRRWIIVGDENYGEGSSREHAAMSPRHLGCAAVVARSFARIHEANLKKQGILPLTFSDPADYERIQAGDRVSFEYLHELDPVRSVNMLVHHPDGGSEVIPLRHTLNLEQIGWFYAGSALNMLTKIADHGD